MTSSPALRNQPNDPRLTTPQELELAQQGEVGAIAALMNRLLQSQGITASVQRQRDCLIVTLTAETVPQESSTVEFIRKGMAKLQPTGINQVQILGQGKGDGYSRWTVTVSLHPSIIPVSSDQIQPTPSEVSDSQPQPNRSSNAGPLEALPVLPKVEPEPPRQPVRQPQPRFSISRLKLLGSGLAILTTVLFSFAVIWYCLHQLANPTAVSPNRSPSSPDKVNRTINLTVEHQSKLVLTGVTWKAKDQRYNLVGTLRNNASHLYTYVKIEFELYDSFGVRVGESMAIVENLGAYQTKTFEALVINNQAVQAKLKKITGF